MVRSINSQTEENYLKAIFKLSQQSDVSVSTNAIAEEIGTKASSVTDMLKKLRAKKLLNYEKYKGVSLTSQGSQIAAHIIRKHRLWEVFLVDKLNFNWDEVHDIAEQLEHIKSPDLIQKLDEFLDNPKFDPHGDPIPNEKGVFPKSESIKLSELGINNKGVVIGVKESSPKFLKYLEDLGLALGVKIVVKNVIEFDNSFELKIGSKVKHISNDVAKNILLSIE